MKKTAIYILFFACITSCEKKTIKGENLKNEDAIDYLTGNDDKTWKLENGHDYYEYLHFTKTKKVQYQNGTHLSFEINGPSLTIYDFKAFSFTLIEIGENELKMIAPGHDTLTYNLTNEKLEYGKNIANPINPKWLKGKYGTTWKFVEGDKTYSFMNNGTIIDANTLTKVDNWSIDNTTLNFGPNKLKVLKLSPVYFDYDVYGMTIQLNYLCEANANGSAKTIPY